MNSLKSKSKIRTLGFVSLLLLAACSSLTVYADSLSPLTVLYKFTGYVEDENGMGRFPMAPLVLGNDGWFYGTVSEEGPFDTSQNRVSAGTVFRVSSSGVMQQLFAFPAYPYPYPVFGADCPFGSGPVGGLVQGSDGNFYGTTVGGGAYQDTYPGGGTVFEIGTNSNLTTLWNFSGGADGAFPCSTLVQGNDGYLYGTTSGYDGFQLGSTIFRFYPSPSTRQITTLYTFGGGLDGNIPSGLVQGSDGNFYGATAAGGEYQCGTLFRMTPGGNLTTLYSFQGGEDGSMAEWEMAARANGLVQGNDGYFYGTTPMGGAYGSGTVFRFNTTNDSLTTLYSFTGHFDGGFPFCSLVQASDGNFYGTCSSGGWGDWIFGSEDGWGTVFVVTPNGKLTTLYAFDEPTGAIPQAGLVQGSNGCLYGTTWGGGLVPEDQPGCGTIFKIFPVGHRWGITNTVTAANSGTWTCPDGIYYATVECWGAGGGGASTTTFNPSGGGGGGAYSKGNVVGTIPNFEYQNLVGVRGSPDNPGGYTAFPGQIGILSVEALGGSQGTLTAGGLGGQASAGIGDVKFSGGNGGAGTWGSQYMPYWSGPGGGGAGSTGNGGNAPVHYSSNGGSATPLYGGNGGTSWELYYTTIQSTATSGTSYSGYGGGGAGALNSTWSATSGGDGFMRISY